MRKIVVAFILGAVLRANSQDNVSARFFGLPDNVVASQIMQGTYNGETKELKPIVHEQILFNNGMATIIKKAEVIGAANIASEYSMTYDVDGKLIKKDVISMEQNSSEPYKENLTFKYITTNGVTRVSYTTQSGKQLTTEEREYDKNGKLYKTTWLDQKGNKMRTITFHGDNDETFFYEGETNIQRIDGMYSEVIYYFDNQKMNKTLTFLDDDSMVATLFVTEYKLDVYGNLLQEKELRKYRAATANERRIMNEPLRPVNNEKIKADELVKEINYSNYLVNDKWVIQIPEVITNNMIDFKFRAMQTADGVTYTINDQNAILKFLDETFQKIKAKKQ
jgi:hypothetical protein